jgi:formate C-acetyltransferase
MMTTTLNNKNTQDGGSWQQSFVPTYSERVKKAKKRATQTAEICIEHARAEIKAFEQYKNEPRIIQRARFLETYLRDKTIHILEDELIVGNVNSKVRGQTISGTSGRYFAFQLKEAYDNPEKAAKIHYQAISMDGVVTPEEKKELEEVILPYFNGKTLLEYNYARLDDELKAKTCQVTSTCQHIPNVNRMSMLRDPGHQMPNFEKVLIKGLKGIREEVEWYMAQLDQPYSHFELKEKRDFYKAVLITLDAAMAYAKRFAELAREMATKEDNPKRKKELQRIAEVCDRVPANPARDWWEAVQSVWMIHAIGDCELPGGTNNLGRFDQYMYPYYKKSIIDEKTMTHDEALELLELFQIKIVCARGASVSLNIGGQTRDGKDAGNEVSMLCLEADEQLSILSPETSFRVWAGTPDKYLRKAVEVLRLGRGKPKFTGDRKAIKMMSKAFPELTIEDWREYALLGCSATTLPNINMPNMSEGESNVAKIVELMLNNGKCALCGEQIGPLTGDPRTFESIEGVRQAFREQVSYWLKYSAKGTKVFKESQASLLPAPFSSSLVEGPLQKAVDVLQGGTWYTTYAMYLVGLADSADSLGVIDKLIYRDKKITWDQLLEAVKANWKGYENLRQLCINDAPKYGNDNDYADEWAAWVMDTWQNSIDWINTQKDLLPFWGGKWLGKTAIGNMNVDHGKLVGGLPNGHMNPNPVADAVSPAQGMDRNGPTAVIKSVSKLPKHRLAGGGPINLRISPQLLATDRDIDNFVSFIRTIEELGIYHVQFNVISSDILRKAMKDPDNYRDLMVRVGSFVSYFVSLAEEQQWDIINRTEHQGL